MIKKEYLDLSERESSYGKVYKVAGPCKLPSPFQCTYLFPSGYC